MSSRNEEVSHQKRHTIEDVILSYRTLEHALKDILGYSHDFSTFLYRFKRLDPELVSFVLSKTAEICQKLFEIKQYHVIVADATGLEK